MDVRSRRQDNRGMTLVELLIAIVILAIITVPLLHAFVSSARVNLDSRKRSRLTTVAQDVMEGLRADSLAELAEEFNYPDVAVPGKGFHVMSRKLINGGSGGISENRCTIDANGGVTGLTWVDPLDSDADNNPSTVPIAGSLSYNFVPRDGSIAGRSDGKFYFTMENVTVEDPGSANYLVDVLVKADAAPYRESGSVSGDEAKHNKSTLVSIDDMNERCDYLFYIDLNKLIDNNCPGLGLTTRDVYCKIDLTLNTTYATVMDLEVRRITTPLSGPALFTEHTQITKTEARNIYLLYEPTYTYKTNNPPPNPDHCDVISFTNNTTDKVNFFVVKQYDSSQAEIRTNLESYENNYRCKVNIHDPGNNTLVRTNLDYNLNDIAYNSGTLIRMDTTGRTPCVRQSSYTYNGSPLSSTEEAKFFTAMGGGKTTDRLYDVTVYIYEEGSINAARSGSHEIPADKLLVSLDGSIR